MRPSSASTLLSYPFRIFFLLTGIYGIVIVLLWAGILNRILPLPGGWPPFYWHSHEMLFGFTAAAIAGFILTAVSNWTGAPPLRNRGLLALATLWLAGRLAMLAGSWLSVTVIALIDLLFLFALAIFLTRTLLRHGNHRNLLLAGIIAVLGLANLCMHIGVINGNLQSLMLGENLALNLITLLMVVIGGRIIPLFTRNWLRNHGYADVPVRTWKRLELFCVVSTALLIPLDLLGQSSGTLWLATTIALLAAVCNGIRLWGWRGWLTGKEPLLWILHLGYAWLVIALLFKGLAIQGWIPASAWQHALGVGAMATFISGVMTRVALGHTGRPLRLPRFAAGIYQAIMIAAILRIATAFQWLGFQPGIAASVVAWTVAFALFVVIYWPILSRPRVDGRPG